jgi:hypothetical protein
MLEPIALAMLISGTLDIVFGMILTLRLGRQVDAMLSATRRRALANSAPSAPSAECGSAGAARGRAAARPAAPDAGSGLAATTAPA